MPSGSNEEVACKDGATNGDLQQPFTAPFDGLYRLTFWAGRRESRSETEGQLRMYVCLDGQDIALHVNCADHRGNRNAMRQFLVHLPPEGRNLLRPRKPRIRLWYEMR